MKKIGMFLALILFLFSPVFAKIYRVPSAFIGTIQGGINVAKDGDTVLVMPGVYYENINFKGKKILVASKFIVDQDTNYIYNTIIDGKDTATVVTFDSGEDTTSAIQGFTITNGCHYEGGGIFCRGSGPRIAYNIIKENTGDSRCIDPDQFTWEGSAGGGIFCTDCSAIIEHNYIIKNSSLASGEGEGCGGGIWYAGKNLLTIRYNLIALNLAEKRVNSLGIGGGGGIWGGDSCIASIYNNTIVNNYAEEGGAGIFNASLLPGTKIFNNIVAFNSSEGIGVLYLPGYMFRPILLYNDVYGNAKGNFNSFSPEIGDTTWGFNRNGVPCDSFHNIIRDPLFVDTANFDFHLLANSPCIDAGDPNSPVDPDSTIADIGAFYYPHTPTFVKDDDRNIPQRFALSQNYPNPFNPITTVPYTVSGSRVIVHGPIHSTLKVYNILGQLVRTLVDEEKIPGNYEIIWDGKDDSGKEVGSGIYFYQLRTKEYTDIKKMVLLR